jgi:predicted membrane protein
MRRVYEDHQMKTRTILIAAILISATVSLSIIYGLLRLVGVL